MFQEYSLAPFHFQVGGRVEYNRVHIATSDPALTALDGHGDQARDFVPLSAAASAIADLTRDTDLAFTYATRSVLPPRKNSSPAARTTPRSNT